MSISFAKVTKATYDALTPVQDRLYYIEDTGEQFLNGKPYNGDDGTRDWLCFTAVYDNATIQLNKVGAPWDITLETSTDGINWTAYTWDGTTGAVITLANAGDKVYWRGDNDTFTQGSNNRYQYVMTGYIRASGNIMSLLRKDCSLKEFAENNQRFQYLFGDCTSLRTAPKLPATKLGYHTYNHCFYNTGLSEVPALPATSFLGSCYANMFDGCKGLTHVPPLPYTGNFACCWGMYANTNIESVEVPEFMYMGKDHLNTAFQGCTRLKYVKVGFHNFNFATTDWLDGVSATGTFICPSDLVISSRSASTVPAGWKITRADAVQGDWSESDSSDPSYILNKPVIPDAQVQSDWDESDSSDVTFIKNKPVIPDITDYLCFTAQASNSTVALAKKGDPYAVTLEYSVDRQNWTAYSFGTTITLANRGDYVCFRGDNPNGFNKTSASWNQNFYNFTLTGTIAASGNIMSLINKQCKDLALVSHEFEGLFSGCTSLVEAPELPATTLANNCYTAMFFGCTSLKKAPNFVVTSLVESCFSSMFNGCTSLVEAPELPATTLAQYCYQQMFYNCTSLKKAPELPATTLAEGCYTTMFFGCTSLTKAPELPATTLANNCYQEMFRRCSSLTEAPELPAMTLAQDCYGYMFAECTSLKYAPELPATNTSPSLCYQNMFDYCTALQYLKVGFSSWNSATYRWLQNVSATGLFVCPVALDTTTRDIDHIPSGWSVTNGANNASSDTTSEVDASSVSNYTVCVGTKQTGVVTVDTALTLNALPNESTEIAYAEVVLDIASNATVTEGANLTFVDDLTVGKRNVCVVRWQSGVAKLYVTIVEDIPQA